MRCAVPLWLWIHTKRHMAVSYHNHFSICWPAIGQPGKSVQPDQHISTCKLIIYPWIQPVSAIARKFQHDVLLKSCRLSSVKRRPFKAMPKHEVISWPRYRQIWKGRGNTPVESCRGVSVAMAKSKAEMLQSQHCRPNWVFAKLCSQLSNQLESVMVCL